ncbi:MAG: hypothetical protein NVSMB31_08690 [Vulcanimicrobiaceae bacterium]
MNYEAIATWSQVISWVIFMITLVWMFNKFIIPVVLAAQKAKNEEIARAEQHRDQAKVQLEELKAHMGTATQDAESIKQRATAQAARELETAVAEARAAGERAVLNAQGELDRSRAAAREQLRGEYLDKALALARERASSRVTPAMNGQLVDAFVASIERGGLN